MWHPRIEKKGRSKEREWCSKRGSLEGNVNDVLMEGRRGHKRGDIGGTIGET